MEEFDELEIERGQCILCLCVIFWDVMVEGVVSDLEQVYSLCFCIDFGHFIDFKI